MTGKDDVSLHYTATQAVQRKGNYWHMLPQYNQCRKAIWEAVNPRTGRKRIDDVFPEAIRVGKRETDMYIELKSGSSWQLVGSDNFDALVGSPPVGVVFSEYALSDPQSWAYIQPILEENDGWAIFISTSRGNNHLKRLYDFACTEPGWFGERLTVDDTPVFDAPRIAQIRRETHAQFGSELGEALFQQEYYCFPAGTKIWTVSGQKPIEQVSINDVVLTHAGRWRKVTKLFQRDYSGDLVEITSAGSCETLKLTENHPVRLCDPSSQTYRWCPARDVVVGDYVVFPRLKEQTIPVIASELAELIAWFIAEGSVAKTLVQFSLNKKETDFAERIISISSQFGKAYSCENETTLVVVVNSAWLADFLTTNCGSGASNKRIPWQLISGHEKLFYETLIDGDGCRGNYGGSTEVYSSISYSLALDMQMLAHMIGKRARVNKRPSDKQSQYVEDRPVHVSDSYSVFMADSRPKRCGRPKVLPQKHGVASLVSSVNRVSFNGLVYNLSVQFDESYVAEGRVVHNCSFEGAVLGAYFSRQIADARKDGRITHVPYQPGLEVDTFWDLGVDDSMAIWFVQHVGKGHHVIDYYESSGYGLEHYAKALKDKGYTYGNHYMPHDAAAREMSSGEIALSRREVAENLGIKPVIIVKRAKNIDLIVQVHIPAARNLIPLCWFDAGKCSKGISALESYRTEYDEEKKKLGNRPLHDWSSHGSSAFITFAVGYVNDESLESVLQHGEALSARAHNLVAFKKLQAQSRDYNVLRDGM